MSAFALFYTPNGIVAISGKEAIDTAILKFEVGLATGEVSGVAIQLEKTGAQIMGTWNDASLMKGLMEAGGKTDWNEFTKETFAGVLGTLAGLAALPAGPAAALAADMAISEAYESAHDAASNFSSSLDWSPVFDAIDSGLGYLASITTPSNQIEIVSQAPQSSQDIFVQGEAAYANGFGPDGKPWNTATTVAPNATQTWGQTGNSNFVTRTTEVTNPNGVVTRISETVDRSTGQVVSTHVYEDGSLVAINEGGNRWALNRDNGQMEHLSAPVNGSATTEAEPPRPPSSSLVNGTGEYTVTLNPGGTLSDIVLLQGRAGNSITVADFLAANPQYTDVIKIPVGATLNVPVRSGDILTIYQSSGAVETINGSTAEITSTTRDIQGNTHVVISRPDGESGRIYVERTLHAGTGEEVSSSAVRVDTITGEVTAVDPVTLVPLSTDAGMEEGVAPDGFTTLTPEQIEALGTPSTPGDPIAVIADAGEGTMTDAGWINGYGNGGISEYTAPPPDPVMHLDENTGWSWYEDSQGETTYVSPSGQVVTQAQYEAAGYEDSAAALSIVSSVYNGVENWGQLNDVQRLSTLTNLYSQIDQLGSAINSLDLGAQVAAGGNLPGDLGSTAGGLGGALSLYNGLENGNALQVISGGIQLGNALGTLVGEGGSNVVSNAIAGSNIGQTLGVSAGQVIQTVPSAMGNAANGPQIPKGKDPIVFVPAWPCTVPPPKMGRKHEFGRRSGVPDLTGGRSLHYYQWIHLYNL